MKQRILFIAPSSYPPNNPEAYVNAKQIKILADAGYEIDLVCGRVTNAYPEDDDNALFAKVNKIVYIPMSRKRNLKNLWHHVKVLVQTGYIYKGINWVYPALKECKKLLSQHKYSYIFTKDYPSEVLGAYLAKRYKIKWVATWNDPYMWIKYPEPYGQGTNAHISHWRKKLIRDIGKYSFKNLFPSDRLRDYMLQYMTGMNPESCVIIPHVLIDTPANTSSQRQDGTLKMIYAGSLGKERNPATLLEGISAFHKKHPNIALRIDLLTIFDRADAHQFENLLERLSLTDIVFTRQPVKYRESLKIIAQYDVCLIIEAPCNEGIFLPSKVIDYFQCLKPIWALSPKCGVLADMFTNKLIDYFSDVTDKKAICKTIEDIVSDYTNGQLPIHKEYPQPYTACQILQNFRTDVLV